MESKDFLKQIKSTRKFEDLYQIPFKTLNPNFNLKKNDIRIVLFCNSCYGSGDLVFALKIYNYIKEWYGIESVILASQPKYFLKNGVKFENVYGLKIPTIKSYECADTKYMKIYNINKEGDFLRKISKNEFKNPFDLICFCPFIATDFAPEHKTFKKFFPYANRFNSLLFSTYNSKNPEQFDFPTGIGKKYLGVLLTEDQNDLPRNNTLLPYPYAMVHISYYYSVDTSGCYASFVKLLCKKYSETHTKLDIVTPTVVLDEPEKLQKLVKYIKKQNWYDEVEIITKKTKEPKVWDSSVRVLRIRCEILPLPYKEYTSLFKYCLPDVLLTGNQSVTDIISCCKDYNIYYQIMPWEYPFATNLNNALNPPGNYLRKFKTACGYEKMDTKMQGNLQRIHEKYDFRVLGKEKMDRIISNIKAITEDSNTAKFVQIVCHSKKKSTVLDKFKRYLI
jgi:hypothetical protein